VSAAEYFLDEKELELIKGQFVKLYSILDPLYSLDSAGF